MKRSIATLAATLASLIAVNAFLDGIRGVATPAIPAPSVQMSADVPTIVKGNNAFALDLYSQLRQRTGNLSFSPYSMSTALAMTYAGARNETAAQMAKVLHFTLEPERLHPAFTKLISDLSTSDRQVYQLAQANRLWGQKDSIFLDTFLKITRNDYGAQLEKVDFVNATEETRRTINTWIAHKTQEKIQDLLPEGALDPQTRLVLTNAIYFNGTWVAQFNPQRTANRPFKVTPTQQIDVPTMQLSPTDAVGMAELDGLKVLEMPYVGNRLSMIILLPEKVDGLAKLEQQLKMENLQKWLSSVSFSQYPVQVSLPKFKIAGEFELKQTLSQMGMSSAFADSADFSGMNGKKDLYLSAVVHKTFVSVNESGTEAAGAGGIVAGVRGGGRLFQADHPFIFLIRDKQSNSILFLGRVVNPLT
jgi:serine protease inhibitor